MINRSMFKSKKKKRYFTAVKMSIFMVLHDYSQFISQFANISKNVYQYIEIFRALYNNIFFPLYTLSTCHVLFYPFYLLTWKRSSPADLLWPLDALWETVLNTTTQKIRYCEENISMYKGILYGRPRHNDDGFHLNIFWKGISWKYSMRQFKTADSVWLNQFMWDTWRRAITHAF